MSSSSSTTFSVNACNPCKNGKRKCDRIWPSCSTCSRVGRKCAYNEDTIIVPSNIITQSSVTRDETTASTSTSAIDSNLGPTFVNPLQGIDPFRHNALRQPTVEVAVRGQAAQYLGTLNQVQEIAATYFDNIYHRLPIISKKRFYQRLPTMAADAKADFTAMCMTIKLVEQRPDHHGESMQSSLYVTLKGIMSLFEATGYLSLEVVQTRLLLAFYEMGHALHPASSMSIATCARAVSALELHPKRKVGAVDDFEAEEQKRVWWATFNLDRFINLCNGHAHFASEDATGVESLPIEDILWAQDIIPESPSPTLATPFDNTVGQLARECQVSHLLGRVVRHIHDPTSDPDFHKIESIQLERTLTAFMPMLIEEQTQFGKYCAALGMCTNALFALHDSRLARNEDVSPENSMALQPFEQLSNRIAEFSTALFGDFDPARAGTMSPFVPFSIYQSTVVQFRLAMRTAEASYKERGESMVGILRHFSRRWQVAERYLDALRSDSPEIMLHH